MSTEAKPTGGVSLGALEEDVRLLDETQRLLKANEQLNGELSLINGIQEGMAAELDFQAIVDLVGGKLVELFATDTMVIGWLDEPAGLLRFAYGVERGQRLHVAPVRIAEVMTGRRWADALGAHRPVQWHNQADYQA